MEGALAIVSIFIFMPSLIFGFIYLSKRAKYRVEELRIQKEMLALDVRKKELAIYEMQEESKRLDRVLDEEIRKLPQK